MNRKIIQIDKDKCVGCGLCVNACQQGAIQIIDGKAQLVHDDYCDGLGRCLPKCPVDAISFSERDIVLESARPVPLSEAHPAPEPPPPACGCPGTRVKSMKLPDKAVACTASAPLSSQLRQWPIQIKLVPPTAPYFEGAKLLIAADCTAFAYGDFHNKLIKDHIVLIGCPKLDEGDYSEKLTAILQHNSIKSIKIVRMEVPCCAGIVNATVRALQDAGKMIPWQIVTISTDGYILED